MPATSEQQANAIAAIRTALREADLEHEQPHPEAFLVTLPGRRKLRTLVLLHVGPHSLLVKTFFCRRPDENHAGFYQWLLRKNTDMYGVAFTTDDVGDVYLTGRTALAGVTPDEVDRLLGCVLSYSDDNFNGALERGFASAIRREWEWRTERGESVRNLEAFRHLIGHPAGDAD
ncbi:YbjN domain-containing protein [Marinactinospora rubrisoli]|uniref:YbjN domain-containing protein n=1 Tax=Marinactinospora rubrisoli TaxID=2715399 RepID=A0ABW2K8W5_9ACTN